MPLSGGQMLKRVREELGLSMRAVESASFAIAAKFANPEFGCPISRICDIESKGVIPNIYRLFSFSAIYGKDFRELCAMYGIDWDVVSAARQCAQIPKTHVFSANKSAGACLVPASLDPAFDPRHTTSLLRMIQKWELVPIAFLSRLADLKHTYAFVGTEDLTMYPLILPGSLLQVDEKRRQVVNEGWRSEYERPIYFIETRSEYFCSWCKLDDHGRLLLQPHPLSPATPRVFRCPQEAEIVGQVVGIAMRLETFDFEQCVPSRKARTTANFVD